MFPFLPPNKQLQIPTASVDFHPEAPVERSRKTMLVFLMVLLFVEFADIKVSGVSLGVVTASIGKPFVVILGFWLLFIHSLIVYRIGLHQSLSNFAKRNDGRLSYFTEVATRSFLSGLGKEYTIENRDLIGSTELTLDGDSIKLRMPAVRYAREQLEKLNGFNLTDLIWPYQITDEDRMNYVNYAEKIPVQITFNYLVYKLPIHLSTGLLAYKLGWLLGHFTS